MTDSPASEWGPWYRGAVVRSVLGVVAAVSASALVFALGLQLLVDAKFLERRLNRSLAAATDGQYRLDIGSVDWGVLGRSVDLERMALVRASSGGTVDSISSDAASAVVPLRVPQTRIDGLHRWALVWTQSLTVDRLALRGPRVELSGSLLEAIQRLTSDAEAWGRGASSSVLRGIAVNRMTVDDGTVITRADSGVPVDSIWGLSLHVDTLSTRSLSGMSGSGGIAYRLDGGSFDGLQYERADSSYLLEVGPGRLSASQSLLSVDSVRYEPPVSDSVFMNHRTYRTNRVRLTIGEVVARGFDLHRLVSDTAVVADLVQIDGLDLDLYRDNHLPEDPDDPPPLKPREVVRRFHHPLDVDTVRVRRSRIQYAKRPARVLNPGRIVFDDFWATAYRVTNDPSTMTSSSPAVIDARADVAGAGQLTTTLRIPLLAPDLSFTYSGRLGAMDLAAFNETFVNLGGVRIEGGVVDSLWFDSRVSAGDASGTLHATYRDLEIETLDRTTGERGLKNRLKTFVVNGLALRSNNLPTESSFRSGDIEYERKAGDSFFKFLWLALRDGIYSLIGLDRLP